MATIEKLIERDHDKVTKILKLDKEINENKELNNDLEKHYDKQSINDD